jgi:hypothetical protein
MLKKMAGWAWKISLAVFLFYLFLAFVLIPAGLVWAIKDQGTKVLKHPVSVRSVSFNPFLLRLGINGLAVQDKDKTLMAGFDRLGVDVSFLRLFRKEYRVESLVLKGLKVNTVLLTDGRINLMDLVPSSPTANVKADAPKAPAQPEGALKESGPAPASSATSLPLVIIDQVRLEDGDIGFLDRSVHPNFAFHLSGINIMLTGLSTRPDAQARLVFDARLGGKGTVSSEILASPFAQPFALETTFTLNNFALDVLSPYVGKYTGRALKDGGLELKMDYRISDNQLKASHKIVVQRFEFGEKVASKDALSLPFGMAVALLEDADGRIKISLPVTGDMSKPDFHYWTVVGQVVRNFFMSLVTKPFAFLGSALGVESGDEEMGFVRFEPGRAELADAERQKLNTLIRGLKEHPKLRLEINGGYDPQADWKAIKTDILARDFQELRAQSSKSDSWIYQMLYQRRFGLRDLWALTNKFKTATGDYDDDKLVAEVKRQLIENAPADAASFAALAAERSSAIRDFMLKAGFNPDRLGIGPAREVSESMGHVATEFTLTVYDAPLSQGASPEADLPRQG